MPDAVVEDVIHAASVWDRSVQIPFGAPPKVTMQADRKSSAGGTQRAALIRRNPSDIHASMLRKTKNFALVKFDQVPAHIDQAAISEWCEVLTKPCREDAELRAEWVVAALTESGALPEEASVAGMERVQLPEGFERTTGEGVIERLSLEYREEEVPDVWPTALVLKSPVYGGGPDSLSIGQQEKYHLAELTFMTECVHNTEHAMLLPKIHWHFLRPPGEGEMRPPEELAVRTELQVVQDGLRTHWKWAKGVPVYENQYPWEIGEYSVLMEDLYECAPCQDGLMEKEHAEAVVKALAALHAAFWERTDVLEMACFKGASKSGPGVKMNDVKEVVEDLLKRSQLPEHVASLMIPASEMRNELILATTAHGRTLNRGAAGASVVSWRITPDGRASSMSYGHTTVGVGARDLALFLSLSLSKDQQEEWTHELKQLYYDTLIADGIGSDAYPQEYFDGDYQVMLWDVAFEHLLQAGREIMAMPTLAKDTPYRERKRVMDQLALPQSVIDSCCRALQLGEAWKAVGVDESSEEDEA